MANRKSVPDRRRTPEQVPHVGVEIAEDREFVTVLLVGHPLSRVDPRTRDSELLFSP
jgi:hypothetical protein